MMWALEASVSYAACTSPGSLGLVCTRRPGQLDLALSLETGERRSDLRAAVWVCLDAAETATEFSNQIASR